MVLLRAAFDHNKQTLSLCTIKCREYFMEPLMLMLSDMVQL